MDSVAETERLEPSQQHRPSIPQARVLDGGLNRPRPDYSEADYRSESAGLGRGGLGGPWAQEPGSSFCSCCFASTKHVVFVNSGGGLSLAWVLWGEKCTVKFVRDFLGGLLCSHTL